MASFIRALEFIPVGDLPGVVSAYPVQRQIDTEDRDSFLASLATLGSPAVCAILEAEAKEVTQYGDLVRDNGAITDHDNMDLSRLLSRGLRKDTDKPVRFGKSVYTSAKRLIGGAGKVWKAIKRSQTESEEKREVTDQYIFMFRVPDALFDSIWENEAGPEGRRETLPNLGTEVEIDEELAGMISRLPERVTRDVAVAAIRKYYGSSRKARDVRFDMVRVSTQNDPVLIVGASGTGKEVVAQSIHVLSGLENKPFVAAHAGAISSELCESTLFGYVKGAHNQAEADKGGWIAEAEGGILFFDEIGDMQLEHQQKLLRWIETGMYMPVGAAKDIGSNVRVVAATNRDLEAMVDAGTFRLDLFNRISALHVVTPSLEECSGEARFLAQIFWKEIAGAEAKSLSESALKAIDAHCWRGNVRELRGVLRSLLSYNSWIDTAPVEENLKKAWCKVGGVGKRVKSVAGTGEGSTHRAECLQHLRRVDEANWACESMLKSLFRDGRQTNVVETARDLISYVEQMQYLQKVPSLFHEKGLFDGTVYLVDKLIWFIRILEKHPDRAAYHWQSDIAPLFDLVRTVVLSEIAALETA